MHCARVTARKSLGGWPVVVIACFAQWKCVHVDPEADDWSIAITEVADRDETSRFLELVKILRGCVCVFGSLTSGGQPVVIGNAHPVVERYRVTPRMKGIPNSSSVAATYAEVRYSHHPVLGYS
jgi:hypothetical protein